MKILKSAVMGLVALGFAATASAQVKVYITGATAYRASVHTAIIKLLGGSGTTLPGGYAYTGSTGVSGANAAIFKGTYNSQSVTIKTSWSGSGAGIQTVAAPVNQFPVGFLPDGVSTSTGGTPGQTDPRPIDNAREAATPQIAFSDVYQGSTYFNGTFNGVTYSSLVDAVVGVVPFVFVKSRGAHAGITNVTPQLAQAAWIGLGYVPLAFFTGNPAHETINVYTTGRDADSGTRTTAFAETGIGIFTTVQQYDISKENVGGPGPHLYAPQSINGVNFAEGEGGENSGGTLAGPNYLGKNGLANSYISYLSSGDANTLVTNGGTRLTYNGVAYSDQAIQEGQYTFWSYEHILYKSSLAGLPRTFAEALRDQILTVDGSPLLSTLHVVRGGDGGVVTADY